MLSLLAEYHFVAEWISVLAAGFAWLAAYQSRKAAEAVRKAIEQDDSIGVGQLHYPESVIDSAHRECVLQCTIINRSSRRKLQITQIRVFDIHTNEINVDWSDSISGLGMPNGANGILQTLDAIELYLRETSGKRFLYARVAITHNFGLTPTVVVYDPYATIPQ